MSGAPQPLVHKRIRIKKPKPSVSQLTLLPPETTTTKGREARQDNVLAAEILTEIFKTSLGPKAMDKMFISNINVITITHDGLAMLKETETRNPSALVMRDLAWTTDTTVGDGTKTAVLLLGALVDAGEKLMAEGIHPSIVTSGFARAAEKAIRIMEKESQPVTVDRETLIRVASTALGTKIAAAHARHLATVSVEAALCAAEVQGLWNVLKEGKRSFEIKDIRVEKRMGKGVLDTSLIRGFMLREELISPEAPKRVEKAKIALLTNPLKIKSTQFVTRFKSKFTVTTPEQMKFVRDKEEKIVTAMVQKVIDAGANVVLCKDENARLAESLLARAGIISVRKLMDIQVSRVSKATGAMVMATVNDLKPEDLGYAEFVEERQIGAHKAIFFEGCKNPKAATILVRGATPRVTNEAERAIHDALMVTRDVMEEPAVVVGGGAAETETAFQLREWANTLDDREQLVVGGFADALEMIPLTLAQNIGLDGLDAKIELTSNHARGQKSFGVSAKEPGIRDMRKEAIFDPLAVKRQVIRAATESACQILRVDLVFVEKLKSTARYQGGSQG